MTPPPSNPPNSQQTSTDAEALHALHALSPLDGRYHQEVKALNDYFSEFAWMKYRAKIEIEYFIALTEFDLKELADFPKDRFKDLRKIYEKFNNADAEKIKEIESETNHDVKALEYFLADRFKKLGLEKYRNFIHFALTSQDINHTAFPLMLKDAHQNVLLPVLVKIAQILKENVVKYKEITMLGHTHGQPATPTTLSKELLVFHNRIALQYKQLDAVPFCAKLGGATGNMLAHHNAYPEKDWEMFANDLIQQFNLQRSNPTTQIEHYDNLGAHCHAWMRIGTILLDYVQDMWLYISKGYFKLNMGEKEIGSSTMPHKANPIHFENAEGNIYVARALLGLFADKLPVSRLQRDLSDSTLSRNVGMGLGHLLLAMRNVLKGMQKVVVNEAAIQQDLYQNPAVLLEIYQTLLRKSGTDQAYELTKQFAKQHALFAEAKKAPAKEVRRKKLQDMHKSIVKLLEENGVPKDKIQALDEVFTGQGIDLDQVMSNIPDLPTSNAEKN